MKEAYFDIIKEKFLNPNENSFRFGSIDDGGYLLSPKHITEASVLFSGGISSNVEFEYDLFRFNRNLKIIMVDPTVSRLKLFVKSILRIGMFKPNKLRYIINTLTFIYLLRSKRVWHSKTWLSNEHGILRILDKKIILSDKDVVLLKLDIEGSEYELLDEIKQKIDLFNCMVFEFHDLDKKNQYLYDFLEYCSVNFQLISFVANPSGGFSKFNQPKVVELTLERKG